MCRETRLLWQRQVFVSLGVDAWLSLATEGETSARVLEAQRTQAPRTVQTDVPVCRAQFLGCRRCSANVSCSATVIVTPRTTQTTYHAVSTLVDGSADLQHLNSETTRRIHLHSISKGTVPFSSKKTSAVIMPFLLTPFYLPETQRGHPLYHSSRGPPCPLLETENSSICRVREAEHELSPLLPASPGPTRPVSSRRRSEPLGALPFGKAPRGVRAGTSVTG